MSFKMKLQVVMAFIFRLPMAVFSIFHLRSMAHYLGSDQPQLAVTDSVVILQLMLAWSVISATIPNLQGCLKSFNTRLGMPAAPSKQESREGYPLVTIGGMSTTGTDRKARKRAPRLACSTSDNFESSDEPTFRPDNTCNITTIVHEDGGSETTADHQHCISRNGSQELIIKKEVRWGVQFDAAAQPK